MTTMLAFTKTGTGIPRLYAVTCNSNRNSIAAAQQLKLLFNSFKIVQKSEVKILMTNWQV